MKLGARVKVTIPADATDWNVNAALAMQGQTGVVEEVQTHQRGTGHPLVHPKCLVVFNTPVEGWCKCQLPVKAFWFDDYELKAV